MGHKHSGCKGGCGKCCAVKAISLTAEEQEFLSRLSQTPFLEVVRFIMKSTKSEHLELVALAPVHIYGGDDSMEQVKKTASVLKSLQDYGIIEIDYDLPITNYDYKSYKKSDVYMSFVEAIEEGKTKEKFIFDIPHMECGSLALTEIGQGFM